MKYLFLFIPFLCFGQSQSSGKTPPSRTCVQLFAEDSGNISNGNGDYSLGNGNESAAILNWGHIAHYDGEIISYGINKRTNATSDITVALTLDAAPVQNLLLANGTDEVLQAVSIPVAQGDVINWQTVTTGGGQNDIIVSAILCYDLKEYECGSCCDDLECFETFNEIEANRPLANTGWNNEINTSGQLHSGDIELCFTVSACANNSPQMIGLNSDIGANANYNTIDYALYVYKLPASNIYRIYIYENGSYRGLFVNQTTPYTGDEFCVRRVGTTVTYHHNGTLIYTSTVASTADLGMDNSFYSTNGGFWGSGQITLSEMAICPFDASSARNSSLSTGIEPLEDDKIANPKKLRK